MQREAMLKKMGIGDADFRDYLTKSAAFVASLNEAQLDFHLNSKHPTLTVTEAAAAFGPDVTEEDISKLFEEAPPVASVMFTNACCGRKGVTNPVGSGT